MVLIWPVRDRNATGRLYQSGFGAGQGFGIFHYAADKIERGGRSFLARRKIFFADKAASVRKLSVVTFHPRFSMKFLAAVTFHPDILGFTIALSTGKKP